MFANMAGMWLRKSPLKGQSRRVTLSERNGGQPNPTYANKHLPIYNYIHLTQPSYIHACSSCPRNLLRPKEQLELQAGLRHHNNNNNNNNNNPNPNPNNNNNNHNNNNNNNNNNPNPNNNNNNNSNNTNSNNNNNNLCRFSLFAVTTIAQAHNHNQQNHYHSTWNSQEKQVSRHNITHRWFWSHNFISKYLPATARGQGTECNSQLLPVQVPWIVCIGFTKNLPGGQAKVISHEKSINIFSFHNLLENFRKKTKIERWAGKKLWSCCGRIYD